jgi:hypothetical protein
MEPLVHVRRVSQVRFEDLPVGAHYASLHDRIDDALCSELGVTPAAGDGVRFAPPGVFPALFLRAYCNAVGGTIPGAVITREEIEFHDVALIGTPVKIDVWIGDKFVKQKRRYLVVEFGLTAQRGRLLVSGRTIMLWPAEARVGP